MAATDERAIHEFPTGTIDDNSLLIMDRPTATPGEYETEKFAIANLGLKLLGGIDFPSNLDTEEQDIFGAINEVNAKAMNTADEYDETASYSKGDYCIYQNTTYRCIKASGTTTGTFVAADWTQIKALEEVKTNTGAINEVNSALSGITLNSNPATGNYHFELSTGWSVTNFMFSRQGNRCYLSGVFTCSTPISTWQFIGRFANLPVSKNINPLTELILFVGADNEPDTPTARGLTRVVLRSTDGYLQASNDMPTARRLFITISWIAQTDVI